MKYFIIVNDAQQGPYSLDELRLRNISSDTLVWAEGMAQWTPAWKVEELKPLFLNSADGQQNTSTTRPPYAHVNPSESAQHAIPEPQKNGHKGLKIFGIVVAVLLLIMAVTNPSKDEHKQVIKENITSGLSKGLLGDSDNNNDPFVAMGSDIIKSFAAPVVNETLDNLIEYHNYLFWSTTTITLSDAANVRTSFGIFGKVFTSDESAIADGVAKALNSNGNSITTSHSSVVDDDSSTGNNVTDDVADSVVSVGAKIGKAAAKRMGQEVSRQLKQELSENTDSSTVNDIGKIIDEVENFLKNL